MQWSTSDNKTYTITGATVPTLEPGFYSAGFHPMAGFYAVRKEVETDDLVLSPDSVAAQVMNEVQRFWDAREKYQKNKLVHKRGILLYGPPGTGKTSIINLITREAIKKGAIVLEFSGHTGDVIQKIREVQGETPILVTLEDVDDHAYDKSLTDFLDGNHSQDNVTFVGTTNYLAQLPDRIKNRPSRVDLAIKVGLPSSQTAREYMEHLAKPTGKKVSKQMVTDCAGFTFAQIKEYFVATKLLGLGRKNVLEKLKTVL